jgi:FkbM family methyltransferase
VEGVNFDFLIGDQDGMSWYDTDCTDPWWPEMRLIKDYLIEHDDTVFDCGGHQGCSAILFSDWAGPNGKVVVFEPNPSNLAILKTNCEINHLTNVTIKGEAVGANIGKATISVENSNSHIISEKTAKCVEVPMVTLDSYIDFLPDFIKLDVEGADIEVLKGAPQILATLPKLMIEIHNNSYANYGNKLEELFQLIDFTKYLVWVQWNYEKDILPWDFITINGKISGIERIQHGTHIFMLPKINKFKK